MKELDSRQRAFVEYLAKALKANEDNINEKIQSLSSDELNKLATSFNDIYNQYMENGTISAKLGAKLNYIKRLNNRCPEGYEIKYFKVGGELCAKCMKQGALPVAAHKKGGSTVIDNIKRDIEEKKCGGKAKKKTSKKQTGGAVTSNIYSAKCGAKIESDKCGGKAKKKTKAACGGTKLVAKSTAKFGCKGTKFQNGGKAYDKKEHDDLANKYAKGQIKQGSKEHRRLQELNRSPKASHDEKVGPKMNKVSREQAQKAAENIKKHLQGGVLNFLR